MNRMAFGGFELDTASGELRNGEGRIRIQEQPLQLLLCLLEQPGEIVPRTDLKNRIWGGDIQVDYEDGLNAAACKLRQILGDSPQHPCYIQTVPRRGYRFVGDVKWLPRIDPLRGPAPGSSHQPSKAAPALSWTLGKGVALGTGLALLAGLGVWRTLRGPSAVVMLLPLQNLSGDPGVDPDASKLNDQVKRDLTALPGIRVISDPRSGQTPHTGFFNETPDLTVQWTLARSVEGYEITLDLKGSRGRNLGQQVLLVRREDLHDVHPGLAGFIASMAAKRPRE